MAIVEKEPKKDNAVLEQENKAPVFKPVEITKDDLTETDRKKVDNLERKKKRRRWLDYVSAVAYGLGGHKISHEDLPSVHFEKKRDAIFDEYKTLAKQNQLSKAEWETQQENQRRKFEEIEKQKEITPEQQKQFDREMADKEKSTGIRDYQSQTDRMKANAYKDEQQASSKSNYPYLDLYYNQSAGTQKLINDIAKLSGEPTDDDGNLKTTLSKDARESYVRDVLGKITEKSVDEKGNTILKFKPDSNKYLEQVSQAINNFKKAEESYNNMKYTGGTVTNEPNWIQSLFGAEADTTKYGKDLIEAEQNLNSAKQEIDNIMQSGSDSKTRNKSKEQTAKTPVGKYFQ